MCQAIFVGEHELTTVGQFKEWFPGVEIVIDCLYHEAKDDFCLCPMDIGRTLENISITYNVVMNDYFIELDDMLDYYRREHGRITKDLFMPITNLAKEYEKVKSEKLELIGLLKEHLCDNPKSSSNFCQCPLCEKTRNTLSRVEP